MNKEKALIRFAETYVPKGEKEYFAALRAAGKARHREALAELAGSFSSLCEKAARMQKDGGLGAVLAFSFSFLRTSLPEGRGCYRIEVHDDTWLLQEHECAVNWSADFAFGPFFGMFSVWSREAGNRIPGIREADIDRLMFYMADAWPRRVSDAMIATWAPAFSGFAAYRDMNKAEDCRFLLGEYRSECSVIHREKAEGGRA
jgi:hypothetical protein